MQARRKRATKFDFAALRGPLLMASRIASCFTRSARDAIANLVLDIDAYRGKPDKKQSHDSVEEITSFP